MILEDSLQKKIRGKKHRKWSVQNLRTNFYVRWILLNNNNVWFISRKDISLMEEKSLYLRNQLEIYSTIMSCVLITFLHMLQKYIASIQGRGNVNYCLAKHQTFRKEPRIKIKWIIYCFYFWAYIFKIFVVK